MSKKPSSPEPIFNGHRLNTSQDKLSPSFLKLIERLRASFGDNQTASPNTDRNDFTAPNDLRRNSND